MCSGVAFVDINATKVTFIVASVTNVGFNTVAVVSSIFRGIFSWISSELKEYVDVDADGIWIAFSSAGGTLVDVSAVGSVATRRKGSLLASTFKTAFVVVTDAVVVASIGYSWVNTFVDVSALFAEVGDDDFFEAGLTSTGVTDAEVGVPGTVDAD